MNSQYVIFKVNGEDYGIDISHIKEIIKPRKVTTVPKSKDYFLGIISLRDSSVPIIDFKKLIGLPDREKGKHIIITEREDSFIGLMIDEVTEILELGDQQIEPAPDLARQRDIDFLEGIAQIEGGRVLILINLEECLNI